MLHIVNPRAKIGGNGDIGRSATSLPCSQIHQPLQSALANPVLPVPLHPRPCRPNSFWQQKILTITSCDAVATALNLQILDERHRNVAFGQKGPFLLRLLPQLTRVRVARQQLSSLLQHLLCCLMSLGYVSQKTDQHGEENAHCHTRSLCPCRRARRKLFETSTYATNACGSGGCNAPRRPTRPVWTSLRRKRAGRHQTWRGRCSDTIDQLRLRDRIIFADEKTVTSWAKQHLLRKIADRCMRRTLDFKRHAGQPQPSLPGDATINKDVDTGQPCKRQPDVKRIA
mmetsp:Transcript_96130/g.220371  ORF Transcript_96130/g.220371 Transcript_96130/m.220371 type:complete len:285 (-) Transcript_96130:371-1225(-)